MTLDTSLGTHDGTIAMYQLLSMANPGSALTVRFSVGLTEELKPTLLASRSTLLDLHHSRLPLLREIQQKSYLPIITSLRLPVPIRSPRPRIIRYPLKHPCQALIRVRHLSGILRRVFGSEEREVSMKVEISCISPIHCGAQYMCGGQTGAKREDTRGMPFRSCLGRNG